MLKRAFYCHDTQSETLSHFGSKERLRNLTKCAINSSAPRTGRRCETLILLITFSAVGCTAGVPFLERDKFLRTFTKLQKAILSFVMPVRLSVRMEQLGFQWTDFK